MECLITSAVAEFK